jgi:hypothetical protein
MRFTKFQDDKEAKIFIAGTRAVREGVDLSVQQTRSFAVIYCGRRPSKHRPGRASWLRVLENELAKSTLHSQLTP